MWFLRDNYYYLIWGNDIGIHRMAFALISEKCQIESARANSAQLVHSTTPPSAGGENGDGGQ